jgi:hypothetical protein
MQTAANTRETRNTRDTSRKSPFCLTTFVILSFALATVPAATIAAAQDATIASAQGMPVAPAMVAGPDFAMPLIYGVSRPFAPRWKATYGLGFADETTLWSSFLKLDELRASDELSDRNSRDNWRHFLGLQYNAGRGFSLQGGVAKSSGMNGARGATLYPTGYEKLRLSTGARWRGDSWGLDGSFSYIPTGATRLPGDASFVPGMGSSGPTWLFALSISRTF